MSSIPAIDDDSAFDMEQDPLLPYWGAEVDVPKLYRAHAYDCGRVDAWLEATGCEPARVRALGPVAEMRGRFDLGILSGLTYRHVFMPDSAVRSRAIVIPVFQDGAMVDLLAISRRDSGVWGCVTGRGKMVGHTTRDAPLRVYREPRSWFIGGCGGVLQLSRDDVIELGAASHLVTASASHALDLAEQVHASTLILVDATEDEIKHEIRKEWGFAA